MDSTNSLYIKDVDATGQKNNITCTSTREIIIQTETKITEGNEVNFKIQ